MRRRALPVIILFLFLVSQLAMPFPLTSSEGDGDRDNRAKGVVITELLPYPRTGVETEYFVLHNAGPGNEDLTGWKVCDVGGCVGFHDLPVFEEGGHVTVAENGTFFTTMRGYPPDLSLYGHRSGTKEDPGPPAALSEGSVWPRMTNTGDFIWLEDGEGDIIDVVVFGRAYQGPGWSGPSGPSPRTGYMLVRDHSVVDGEIRYLDTDTALDWPTSKMRRPENIRSIREEVVTVAKVTPLLFPDHGWYLADVLGSTGSELLLNTYEIRSRTMADDIGDLARDGADVKVLLERSPVGGMSETERYIIDELEQAGVEVRLIGTNVSQGLPGAFRYDHAKYMVMDGGTVAIMSENLVPGSLGTWDTSSNRGWGIVVEAEETAMFFRDLFLKDWGSRRALAPADVWGEGWASGVEPDKVENRDLAEGDGPEVTSFKGKAEMVPLVSPDGSEEVLLDIIGGTEERLYIQLLSCEVEWEFLGYEEKNPLLLAVVDAARRGAEVKVMLDDTFVSTNENGQVAKYLNEVATAEGLDLEVRFDEIPGITMLHNKGLIADDMVVVSSINWVDTSLRDNREVGLAVQMEGLGDHLADLFLEDWETHDLGTDMRPVIEDGKDPRRFAYPTCGLILAFGAVAVLLMLVRTAGVRIPGLRRRKGKVPEAGIAKGWATFKSSSADLGMQWAMLGHATPQVDMARHWATRDHPVSPKERNWARNWAIRPLVQKRKK